jgi:ketosteroid isomerase-like protein
MISLATKYPNIYIDTSAYTAARYPAEIVEYLRGHGRRKVLFGSNHPAWPATECLRGLDHLGLDEETRELFLHANAERVFKLTTRAEPAQAMHQSEKLIRDFYAAQGRFYAGGGSAEEVEALMTEDIAWHVPGRNAIAGHYQGRHEVMDYFSRRRDLARGSLRVEIRRVLADDEYVLQLAGGQAELRGTTHPWETVGVYRIRDGRIAECWLVPFDQYAFDEIWR